MPVVVGRYLGFAAILALSVAGALGAGLLPERVLPWLGLIPLLLGLRAGWLAWRDRNEAGPVVGGEPTILAVAAVTLANGGDNLGVSVPVFAVSGVIVVYVVVFLVLVGVWCVAGWFFATRPVVARALARWGHVALPVVLVGIGVLILLSA